jgi:hypothetical protein
MIDYTIYYTERWQPKVEEEIWKHNVGQGQCA